MFRISHIVIITNFVVVSSVGIKRVVCIANSVDLDQTPRPMQFQIYCLDLLSSPRDSAIVLETNELRHSMSDRIASEDSDQPAPMHNLIRVFVGQFVDSQGSKAFSCRQRRLRSACADAQADLSLR